MKALALAVLLLGQEPSTPHGVVTGQIRAPTGEPSVNVRVVAIAAPTPGAADGGFAVFESITQTDASGQYRLEGVPPGRYVIAAVLIDLPTYYPGVKTMTEARVVSVAASETASGIDFALAQPAGVRVFGRVAEVPAGTAVGTVRVVLLPVSRIFMSGRMQEAQVQSDGSFEFRRMPPGKYNLRLLPAVPPVTLEIDVQDQDVGPLSLSLPLAVSGRVVVEGGGNLPVPRSAPAGASVSPLLVLNARRTDSAAALSTQLRSDGTFLWMIPAGEYELGVAMLPVGYSVKSMEYGNANLLEVPLKISDPPESPSASIRITLTTTPLPGDLSGVKVSGYVLGIPGDPLSGEFWLRLQTSTVQTGGSQSFVQRVAEAQVRSDGTFEILRVPPGTYSAQVIQGGALPISGSVAIVVDESDVVGAELVANPDPLSIVPPGPRVQFSPSLLGTGTLPSTEPRGVGVRGSIQLPSGAGYPDKVVLFGSRPGGPVFESPVQKDGSFEFKTVPPGMYDARTLPMSSPPDSTAVLVEARDLTAVQIPAPALSDVRGHIDFEGATGVLDVAGLGIRLISTEGSIEIPVSSDGGFAMKINQGEYRVSVVRLPPNYVVRTATHGATDLLKASYNTGTEGEIRITIGPR